MGNGFFSVMFIAAAMLGIGQASADTRLDFTYPSSGPFYAGDFRDTAGEGPAQPPMPAELHFASYNIHIGQNVAGVVQDLEALRKKLGGVDYLYLQEVDGTPGGEDNNAETIARALHMNYVYAPAMVRGGRDYGNAILSQWSLTKLRKTLLPCSPSGNQRIALVADSDPFGKAIQVATLHLSVFFIDSLSYETCRVRQVAEAVKTINDSSRGPTFVAGDFNNFNPVGWTSIKLLMFLNGFKKTPDTGWTIKGKHLTIDHSFARGMELVDHGIEQTAIGSDHVPIWAVVRLK
jgi:endonuclease/exonuclease/phosphatase family metal-dependent hydrolase